MQALDKESGTLQSFPHNPPDPKPLRDWDWHCMAFSSPQAESMTWPVSDLFHTDPRTRGLGREHDRPPESPLPQAQPPSASGLLNWKVVPEASDVASRGHKKPFALLGLWL